MKEVTCFDQSVFNKFDSLQIDAVWLHARFSFPLVCTINTSDQVDELIDAALGYISASE